MWATAFAILTACSGPAQPPTTAPPPETTPVVAPQAPAPLPPAPPGRYAASQVLITHAGAARAEHATRTEAEAASLAANLHAQALAGATFTSLARAAGDPNADARNGQLGVYSAGTLVPEVERAVASVAPGEIAPLVQSPYGFHLLRRDAIVQARARHLVVGFDGAPQSRQTRSRAEAEARIAEASAQIAADSPFESAVETYSDDADTRARGGDLGLIAPGQLVPAFDQALFVLTPGEVSQAVETPWGLHLIQRLE